jgi:hypothetical protein
VTGNVVAGFGRGVTVVLQDATTDRHGEGQATRLRHTWAATIFLQFAVSVDITKRFALCRSLEFRAGAMCFVA